MNISYPTFKQIAVFLLLVLVPLIGWSQGYETFEILEDEVYEEYFFSTVTPNAPAPASQGITEVAYHTTINGQLQYVFRYTPNPGFIGTDQTHYTYSSGFNTLNYAYRQFKIVESQIIAEDDYFTMSVSSTGEIDVLANDESSTGTMTITSLPLVNNGTVSVDANQQITFTPDHAFVGVTKFHYTVCNEDNICDVATVNVFVEEGFPNTDTTQVFVKKNGSVNILVPTGGGYFTQRNPIHGTVASSDPAGIMVYSPDPGFTGTDNFTSIYLANGVPKIRPYKVTVLDAPVANNLLKADNVFTGINESINFNVLENDVAEGLTILSYSDPVNGTINVVDGDVFYQPSAEFEGLDEFTYIACLNNSPVCEQTSVYVTVSDQEPGATIFNLSTPINTPLVIDYDIPTENWWFVLQNQATEVTTANGGLLEYFDGEYGGNLVNGQTVEGYNLAIYTPPADEVLDESIEISFCTAAGCQRIRLDIEVTDAPGTDDPYCVTECVWPGDANQDGQVNVSDLLPMGYCVGETGPARNNGSTDWYGQYGTDWGRTIGDTNIDLKHIDADGDGVITSEDTEAIMATYGNQNNIIAKPTPAPSIQPLHFISRNLNPQPGDLVIIDIVFGTEDNPVLDANGLTFSVNYNAAIIEPGSINIDFDESSWLRYDAPTAELIASPFENRLDAGLTRTIGRGASGFGNVGTLSFIIIEDIDGIRPGDNINVNTDITNSNTMNSNGEMVGLTVFDPTLLINFKEPTEQTEEDLVAFPNPTVDYINLHLNGNDEMLEVEMFTLAGQKLYHNTAVNSDQLQINVTGTQFANGMYMIRAKTGEGLITKKVQIMK